MPSSSSLNHSNSNINNNSNSNSNSNSSNGISKKVEFTTTYLDPIDSEAPTPLPNTWDTENDYILSYFLGGGESNGGYGAVAGARASSSVHTEYASTSSIKPKVDGNSHSSNEDQPHQNFGMPPPTPTVQFFSAKKQHQHQSPQQTSYLSQNNQKHQLPRQNSSSASLSSMTASLISGKIPGGLLYSNGTSQQQHLQRSASQNSMGTTPPIESPISPAAMIGMGYENLLLPPPTSPIPVASEAFMQTNNAYISSQHANLIDANSSNNSEATQQYNPLLPYPGIHSNTQILPPVGTMWNPAQHPFLFNNKASSCPETEEKRAKRLERNRESARKSRRRKKERLQQLSKQVHQLQSSIAKLRRQRINEIVPIWMKRYRQEQLEHILEKESNDNDSNMRDNLLADIVPSTGPSSPMMRSVLDFQYTTLRQMTLPSYQKMLLWFTLCDPSYFMAAKEQYGTKCAQQLQESSEDKQRSTIRLISSKQIGDELLNGNSSGSHKKKKSFIDDNSDQCNHSNITANAHDAVRCWALFCLEHKFSVEQEDRFVATHKQLMIDRATDLVNKRNEMAAAVMMVDSLGKAMGSLAHVVAQRQNRTYLQVLDASQVATYHTWLNTNRQHLQLFSAAKKHSISNSSSISNKVSVHDICRRLDQVLQISSKPME